MDIFEFDENKSRTNFEKHGIDFLAAQKLWKDIDLVQIAAKTEGEQRYLVVGKIDHKHWSAVITYRGAVIRIISVRRSRPEEVKIYEG